MYQVILLYYYDLQLIQEEEASNMGKFQFKN